MTSAEVFCDHSEWFVPADAIRAAVSAAPEDYPKPAAEEEPAVPFFAGFVPACASCVSKFKKRSMLPRMVLSTPLARDRVDTWLRSTWVHLQAMIEKDPSTVMRKRGAWHMDETLVGPLEGGARQAYENLDFQLGHILSPELLACYLRTENAALQELSQPPGAAGTPTDPGPLINGALCSVTDLYIMIACGEPDSAPRSRPGTTRDPAMLLARLAPMVLARPVHRVRRMTSDSSPPVTHCVPIP